MNGKWIKPLFVIAGLYDGILGLAFLFLGLRIFQAFAVTPPNHIGYIQFPALLLLVFAAMFFRVATDPNTYRHLMVYGMALKASYTGLVFWHELTAGIPAMWMPWAWVDLAFLVLFAVAWKSTGPSARLAQA
jgi:hypothetical protein